MEVGGCVLGFNPEVPSAAGVAVMQPSSAAPPKIKLAKLRSAGQPGAAVHPGYWTVTVTVAVLRPN
jgi:hypothetical protein